MSNIDKQAVQAVADLKAGYILGHADVAILQQLARIALASLEAEAVAYIRDGFRADGVHFCGGIITAEEHERTKPALSDRYNWKHQPLYTAPPAPALSIDKVKLGEWLDNEVGGVRPEQYDSYIKSFYENVMPALVPASDSLLSELLTIAKTAANAADECAHAEFSDDSMEYSAAIADWERRAAMLQGADGNSPDGWVACSERMPEEGQEVIVMDTWRGKVQSGMVYEDGCFVDFNELYYKVDSPTHWMPLPAAPQKEVES